MACLEVPQRSKQLYSILTITAFVFFAIYSYKESFGGSELRKTRLRSRLLKAASYSWTDDLLDNEPRPRIYIYDLPSNATACFADCVEFDTESLYSSTVVISQLLRNSSHFTSDPDRADLFYIPSPIGHITLDVRSLLATGPA